MRTRKLCTIRPTCLPDCNIIVTKSLVCIQAADYRAHPLTISLVQCWSPREWHTGWDIRNRRKNSRVAHVRVKSVVLFGAVDSLRCRKIAPFASFIGVAYGPTSFKSISLSSVATIQPPWKGLQDNHICSNAKWENPHTFAANSFYIHTRYLQRMARQA